MNIDEKYMFRCIQLAKNGRGFTQPNPMVGAVIVHKNKIIGEGFHRCYGQAHAEVNAINSVKDKSLLKKSTLYVSLEPCSHYGKTPPCAQLIINHHIPRVIIATTDPYPAVSGRGVKMLEEAGIEVTTGILQKDSQELNKEFFVAQTEKRAYIFLKWAQSSDGYIDHKRTPLVSYPAKISDSFTQILVHKKRTEVAAIMVGTNTVLADNPNLTSRLWYGKDPVRIILDRQARIPTDSNVLNGKVATIVFTESVAEECSINGVKYVPVKFDSNLLKNIFSTLAQHKLNSVLVEGGACLLRSVIKEAFWDEAYVEIANMNLGEGVSAPTINGLLIDRDNKNGSLHLHYVCHL